MLQAPPIAAHLRSVALLRANVWPTCAEPHPRASLSALRPKGCRCSCDVLCVGVRWGARCTLYCQVVTAASEAAEMILRVDDIIKCAPRQRGQEY